jgi:ribonuclease-3
MSHNGSDTSSEGVPELPFNPVNVVISSKDVTDLLSTYSVLKTPVNLNLYKKSMVHKSYCTRKNENAIEGNVDCPPDCLPLQEESNERLEFLGDSVLNMVVATYLFERFPDENEGFLTKMRTKLVNGRMLAHLSKTVSLNKHILISKQIEDNEGRYNLNILEDAFEAFIAAIYLDLGFEEASNWIIGVIEYHIDFADLIIQNNNYKDQFFKLFQQVHGYLPKFFEMNVETNSRMGQKVFTVCIKDAAGVVISIGKGRNKKEAENDAAQKAMDRISIVQRRSS